MFSITHQMKEKIHEHLDLLFETETDCHSRSVEIWHDNQFVKFTGFPLHCALRQVSIHQLLVFVSSLFGSCHWDLWVKLDLLLLTFLCGVISWLKPVQGWPYLCTGYICGNFCPLIKFCWLTSIFEEPYVRLHLFLFLKSLMRLDII